MSSMTNKCILVVGVSSGIGRAAAGHMAQQGAKIIGVGRKLDAVLSVINSFPGEGHQAIEADVSSEKQLAEIINVGKQCGGYDGGVFCAGLHEMRPFTMLRTDDLLNSFNANVTTAIHCTKALSKAVNPNGAGIVWLSSVAAMRGTAGFAAYAAAKGALISAAKVAAVELAKKKIRVNVIAAGVVETSMSESWMGLLSEEQRDAIKQNHLLGIGQPSDVAGAISFLVSPESRWITGATLVVDGGLSIR